MSNTQKQPALVGQVEPSVRPQTCAKCQHALWARTPTGRIKAGVAGRCGKAREIVHALTKHEHPPCVVLQAPHTVAIWPDYDASGCDFAA
jgi:hypothetical protein